MARVYNFRAQDLATAVAPHVQSLFHAVIYLAFAVRCPKEFND
jgi:hypothetical protein